jgi:hypothetical protein
MGHKAIDPHKTDDFWIEEMKRVLKKESISPEYRKRCEVILADCKQNKAEHQKQDSLHYPRERKMQRV